MQTGIVYSNDFLTLAPFAFTRTNGAVNGRLDLDLSREVYGFDLRSTIDPPSIGQIVSPVLLRALAIGNYGGPATVHAAGSYDNNHPARTDVQVEADAERVGLKWFTADHTTFTVRNRGLHYEATNITGQAYGGDVGARFFFYSSPQPGEGDRYELDMETSSNDLRRVALAMHPNLKDPPGGTMKLKLQIAGLVDDPDLRSVKGEGSVRITEGQLHKIRIFGLLSTLLAKLTPDLGYASLTSLKMSFDIRDGKLTTSDLQLGGQWLNVKGKGTYSLADSKLDFLAEVQLFKKGTLVGDAVRLITSPVTKLFQIQLTGTLENPEWKTANLPKIF